MSDHYQEPRIVYSLRYESLLRSQRIKELIWALTSLKKEPYGIILNIGCGRGYETRLLAELGYRVIGLDISSEFAKEAKTKLRNVQSEIIVGDAMHLAIKSSSMDAVTCFEVLEHMQEPEVLLSEIRRVLKNEGFLILTTPLKHPINIVLDKLRGEKTHVSQLPLNKLIQLLRKSFSKVIYKTIFVLPIPPTLFKRYFYFEKDIFPNHIWVVATN